VFIILLQLQLKEVSIMGITFSTISGAIKRAVSADAREAHRVQQEKLDQIRKNIRANKAGENQEVTALINRVQDEVHLDQFIKLRNSLPSAPTHRPGTTVPNRLKNN
jgi:hypothetical protein